MLMMSAGLNVVASRFGDILGTHLYNYYGSFAACVIVITVVYASILPALSLVPKDLIATADGQISNSAPARKSPMLSS
jgi:hypothetical protein